MKGLNNPIGIKSSDPNQSPFITNPYRFAGGETSTGVTWCTSTALGMSFSTNTATKNVSSGWYSGMARSVATFTPSDEIVVEFTTSHCNEYVGFGQDPFNSATKTWQDLEFGMKSDKIAESGSLVTPNVASFTRVSGEDLRMTMDASGTVKYYFEGTLVHTSTKTASGTYYIETAIYDQSRSTTASTIT